MRVYDWKQGRAPNHVLDLHLPHCLTEPARSITAWTHTIKPYLRTGLLCSIGAYDDHIFLTLFVNSTCSYPTKKPKCFIISKRQTGISTNQQLQQVKCAISRIRHALRLHSLRFQSVAYAHDTTRQPCGTSGSSLCVHSPEVRRPSSPRSDHLQLRCADTVGSRQVTPANERDVDAFARFTEQQGHNAGVQRRHAQISGITMEIDVNIDPCQLLTTRAVEK